MTEECNFGKMVGYLMIMALSVFVIGLMIGSAFVGSSEYCEVAQELPVCVRREGGLVFCEVLNIEFPCEEYGVYVEMNESVIDYSYADEWD